MILFEISMNILEIIDQIYKIVMSSKGDQIQLRKRKAEVLDMEVMNSSPLLNKGETDDERRVSNSAFQAEPSHMRIPPPSLSTPPLAAHANSYFDDQASTIPHSITWSED